MFELNTVVEGRRGKPSLIMKFVTIMKSNICGGNFFIGTSQILDKYIIIK